MSFEILPNELLVLVLKRVGNPRDLRSVIAASRRARVAFAGEPLSILRHVLRLAFPGANLHDAMSAIHAGAFRSGVLAGHMRCADRWCPPGAHLVAEKWDVELRSFLGRHFRMHQRWKWKMRRDSSEWEEQMHRDLRDLLREFEEEVSAVTPVAPASEKVQGRGAGLVSLTQLWYLVDRFTTACFGECLTHLRTQARGGDVHSDELVAAPISGIEYTRIQRALLRLEVFRRAVPFAPWSEQVFDTTWQARWFFVKLEAWEREEILCVHRALGQVVQNTFDDIEDNVVNTFFKNGVSLEARQQGADGVVIDNTALVHMGWNVLTTWPRLDDIFAKDKARFPLLGLPFIDLLQTSTPDAQKALLHDFGSYHWPAYRPYMNDVMMLADELEATAIHSPEEQILDEQEHEQEHGSEGEGDNDDFMITDETTFTIDLNAPMGLDEGLGDMEETQNNRPEDGEEDLDLDDDWGLMTTTPPDSGVSMTMTLPLRALSDKQQAHVTTSSLPSSSSSSSSSSCPAPEKDSAATQLQRASAGWEWAHRQRPEDRRNARFRINEFLPYGYVLWDGGRLHAAGLLGSSVRALQQRFELGNWRWHRRRNEPVEERVKGWKVRREYVVEQVRACGPGFDGYGDTGDTGAVAMLERCEY